MFPSPVTDWAQKAARPPFRTSGAAKYFTRTGHTAVQLIRSCVGRPALSPHRPLARLRAADHRSRDGLPRRLRLPLRHLSRPGARLLACHQAPAGGPLQIPALHPRSARGPAMPPRQLRRDGSPGAAAGKLVARGELLDQISGNPSNFPDPVPRNAAMLNQLSASSSSTPTATLSPQQKDVINFLITCTRPLNRTSAFNLGTHTSDFAPQGADSTLELAFANLSLGQPGSQQMAPRELMQNNYGAPAMRVPSLHQPGQALLTLQRLMQNREVLPAVDIKGKGPALGVGQQELRVHVACLMADDGSTGAAGLLIKKETWQFICALCFPMRSMEETVLFAAACCEGIKVAQAYQPTSIVLESHLFHLVDLLLGGAHAPCRDTEELAALVDLSRCRVQHITKESNDAAHRLAMRCLLTGVAEIFFNAPNWLLLT